MFQNGILLPALPYTQPFPFRKERMKQPLSASPADELAEALKNSYQNIHFDFIDFQNDAQNQRIRIRP